MAMKLDFNDRNRDSLIESYLDALSDKMDDIFNAVAVLKAFCAHHDCNACAFNRAENGCYDCMLTNESPCEWDVKEIGGADDAGRKTDRC